MNARVRKTVEWYYKNYCKNKPFRPGITAVSVAGKVFDKSELIFGVEAVLDHWWTEGRFAQEFERKFSEYLNVRYVTLVNSESSASLLAVSALTSSVFGDRSLRRGDEVITVPTNFPTTVNAIIQNGCKPVFIDCDLSTKTTTAYRIQKALSKKTKAIILTHTLGNPLPLKEITEIINEHNLWFIEDCGYALGSRYNHKPVGSYGHIATFSFYAANQITMGEGGAIVTDNPIIHRTVRQFRDWGRDCWCDTGKDDTCKKRFGWQLGRLPLGYDHKFTYSQIGYSLRVTDIQAAIGLAQLEKLPKFIRKRQNNYSKLLNHMKRYENYFIFTKEEKFSEPCWFGFMMIVRNNAPFTKLELITYLEKHKIATRGLFGGNLLRQPAYAHRKDIRLGERILNADIIMNNGFWIGIHPGITDEMTDYVLTTFDTFLSRYL